MPLSPSHHGVRHARRALPPRSDRASPSRLRLARRVRTGPRPRSRARRRARRRSAVARVARARDRVGHLLADRARHERRRRIAAVDRPYVPCELRGHRMGGERVHDRVRRMPAAGGRARRPRGPQARAARRARGVLRRVARLRARAVGRAPECRARGQGHRRRDAADLSARRDREPLLRRPRARAWAIWGMCMGVATAIAPLVGGAIAQWIGWRWIFLLNLPVCIALAAAVRATIDESRDPHAKRIDAPGSVLFGAALALGIWALIDAPSHGWTAPGTLARFAASAALGAAFVAAERWQRRPMIDLALFRTPRFVGALLAMFGYAACAQVMMTFLPLYLQIGFGMSAIDAGLGMLPFALAMIVGPSLGAALSARAPAATVLGCGLALIGIGNFATAALAGASHYGLVALGMMITGCGAGILNGDTQKAIMACVPPERTGMASGISTTTRFSAIVTSVGVLGAVLAEQTHAALAARVAHAPALLGALDPHFMSSLLAGDLAQAIRGLPPRTGATLAHIAPGGFASGFSLALCASGAFALAAAVAVRLLVGAQPGRAA
ncbi:drug resistance transporter family protein [Burkholderia mallei PRL-20]|nr:drug resistance transporter family protein [Burkholderia mallei PRL-20]